MRHRVKGRKLGRSTPHRKATLRALSSALIREHRIETTLAKAKELRTFVEPLITRAKEDNTHNRRIVYSYLQDKYAVTELFETVGPAAADRPGGYTRVLKLGFRLGDAAEMAMIELVDFNDVQPEGKTTKKKRTRRAGKSVKTETEGAKNESAKEEKSVAKEAAKKQEANEATAEAEAGEVTEAVEETSEKETKTKSKAEPAIESDEEKSSGVKESKKKAEDKEGTKSKAKAEKKTKAKEAKKESEDVAAQQDESDDKSDSEKK